MKYELSSEFLGLVFVLSPKCYVVDKFFLSLWIKRFDFKTFSSKEVELSPII